MSKLRDEQSEFALRFAQWVINVYEQGYEITFGDAFAQSGHSPHSFHYKRLAIDVNLFKDGEYLTETEDHRKVGEMWERMGGTWGGRFSNKDGNHYSWGEGV